MEAQHYRGQVVRIIANFSSHGHRIGETVKLKKAKQVEDVAGYWALDSGKWAFDSEECEPVQMSKGRW